MGLSSYWLRVWSNLGDLLQHVHPPPTRQLTHQEGKSMSPDRSDRFLGLYSGHSGLSTERIDAFLAGCLGLRPDVHDRSIFWLSRSSKCNTELDLLFSSLNCR